MLDSHFLPTPKPKTRALASMIVTLTLCATIALANFPDSNGSPGGATSNQQTIDSITARLLYETP